MTSSPILDAQSLAAALAGQYQIIREVGRGGMGIVYLARDLKLDRLVAIKTLPPQFASDAVIRERFVREARTAARLTHPNIVPIHRADEIDGHVFFVMGFVDGAPLSQIVREGGPLSPRAAVAILLDVAAALGYAHEFGIVHRDVKAENILVDRATGRALVTDFGIARLAEAAPLTATGTVLGTVYYMSPEQVAGDAVDPRSDIYSLGVVAFFALSGRFPFEHATASAVLVAHVTKAAPSLAAVATTVPFPLASAVDRALAKDPAARYQDCREFSRELERVESLLPSEDVAAPAPASRIAVSSTEAQDIWRRASELADHTGPLPATPAASDGVRRRTEPLTEGYQVQQVLAAGREAGIGTAFMQRALDEHGLGDAPRDAIVVRDGIGTKPNAFLGRSTRIAYEATIPGEMPDRDFDLLVDSIRRVFNEAGMVSVVGRSLTWTASDRRRRVQVTVLVRDGRTSIHVGEHLRDLAGGLFGGIMGGGTGGTIGPLLGVALQGLHQPMLIPVFILGSLGFTYTLARTIYGRVAGGRARTLRELTERLAQEARDSIARQTLAPHRPDRKLPR